MKLTEFVSSQHEQWDELDALIAQCGNRGVNRLGAAGVRRFGQLYRSASGDLAFARRRWPGDPVIGRLERTVTRARGLVYSSTGAARAVVAFFRRDFWRSVLERPLCLLAAVVLLFGPALLSGVWAWRDPAAAGMFVPSQYREAAQRDRSEDAGDTPTVDQQSVFTSEIMTNNIRVTFFAFGGGLLLGLGTIYALLQNGMLLGVLSGLAISSGNGKPFFELILPHGLLELSCIAVGGAAGLRIAWAIIAPGHRRRSDALRVEAQGAVRMVIGASLWLVVAGLVEGFITPQRVGFGTATAIGVGLALVFWVLVVALGRRDRVVEPAADPVQLADPRGILQPQVGPHRCG